MSFRILTLLFLIFSAGCGVREKADLSGEDTVTKECRVAEDQLGSFKGVWPTLPIPLAFHDGSFSSSSVSLSSFDGREREAKKSAVESWNRFSTQSRNARFFALASEDRSEFDPSKSCSKENFRIVNNGKFEAPIIIYEYEKGWPYGDQVVAVTYFCNDLNKKKGNLPLFRAAVMEFDGRRFDSGSEESMKQLEAVAAHELGHVAGLGHSCNDAGEPGVPSCSANSEYAAAVMNATYDESENFGETRRTPQKNDQERANCLPY